MVTLVTDPEGDYIIVEQPGLWLGADPEIVAYRLAPADWAFLTHPDVTRFARLDA